MNVVEPIALSQLGEASQADLTDNTLAIVSVPSSGADTGYVSKKSLLSRLKEFFLGSTSISSIGDGTVTGAISSLNNDLAKSTVSYTGTNSTSVVATRWGRAVSVTIWQWTASAWTRKAYTELCTLDTQFRPARSIPILVYDNNANTVDDAVCGTGYINADGLIRVYMLGGITRNSALRCEVNYIIE